MREIIQKARELALSETEKNGTPIKEHFELANSKGQELAEKLGKDKDIVLLGTILMDLKLGECFKEGKLPEHVKRSSEAAKTFLNQFKIDQKVKDKIINCIEAHHKEVPFSCKEAEICANADCYRFLHPRGVFAYFKLLGTRFSEFEKVMEVAEAKLEEKKKILSLDICKKELEPYYITFKTLFQEAKKPQQPF